jgi:hypothetical protein
MCESGINIGQLKLSIGQVDDALSMSQQWLEQLHHLADHGKKSEASKELAQATVLLGEARGKLDDAISALEGRSPSDDDGVEVELV